MNENPNVILRAAIWMVGAIFSFLAMAVAGRELGGQLDTFEIMMYRSVAGLVIVCILLSATGHWHHISTANLGSHLFRNLAHFTGQNLWFYAVTVIPMAQLFALEFTSPLWVIVLAPIFLGERLTKVRGLAAALGFIGIVIVARPTTDAISLGTITAAGSAIFFAATSIATKRLTRSDSIGCIMFWLTCMQSVLGLITAGFDGDITLPNAQTAPWLLVITLAGLTAHFCLTNALAIAPATIVVPMDFVRLPAIAVIAMVYYGEPLDIYVLVGAVVIFGGNYINILAETRKNRVA